MKKNEIILRDVKPEDCYELKILMEKVWKRKTTAEYWHWKLFEGPIDKKGIVFENKKGHIVGFNAYWIRPTISKGKIIFPWQSTDTMADPEFRGGQMFMSIINILVSELQQKGMVFGWPNPTAFKLFSKFLKEFRLVETSMSVFLAVINSGSFIRLPKLVQTIANGLSRSLYKFRLSYPSNPKIIVQKIQKIDDDFDQLWEDINSEYYLIQERKKDYLKWRFLLAPHREYQIWKALENSRLVGYLVTTIKENHDGSRGFLVDWLVSRKRNDILKEMIKTATKWFIKQEVDAIETWLFDHEKGWRSILKRFFFMKIQRKEYFLAAGQEELGQKEMFLTIGDSDRI
ncbi:MAG: hypothetical protein ACW99F_18770 [Candidatus Hodarchaeales archaeon]|jgi:hypothetical protein